MEEIHKLRAQINSIVSVNFPGSETGFESKLKPPSDLQVSLDYSDIISLLTVLGQSAEAVDLRCIY